MTRLKDKRALITGGTTGIGLETARQFLAEGARVAITGSSPASVAAAKAELGGDVLGIPADAGDVAASSRSPRPSATPSAGSTSCSSMPASATSARSPSWRRPASTARSPSTSKVRSS